MIHDDYFMLILIVEVPPWDALRCVFSESFFPGNLRHRSEGDISELSGGCLSKPAMYLPCIDLWQNDKTIIRSQRLNSSYTSVVPDTRSEHDAWKMRHFLVVYPFRKVPEPVLLRDMVNKRQKKHKQQRWFGFGCFFFWCVFPCPFFRLRLVLFRLVDLAESGSITQPELEFLMTQVREEKPGESGGFFVG